MGRRFPGSTGSSSGGGGSSVGDGLLHSDTPVATAQIDRTGHDDKRPYTYTSGLFPGASPNGNVKSRNVFATWAQWQASSLSATGFHISSFSVDRSTGAITVLQSGPQSVWEHTQGAALSTTYLVHDAVHGCFFSAGNNAYNNASSHVFGYTAGQVATDGSVNGGTNANSGYDHSVNGTFCGGLHQGTGTNYFMISGYQSSGSYNGFRINEAASTGITIGSWTVNGSWTSSGNNWRCIWQPDATVNAGEVEAGAGASFSSPNYGWNLSRGGTNSNQIMDGGSGNGNLYQGAGGVPFVVQNDTYGTMGNTSNNFISLIDGDRDFGNHIMDSSYGVRHIGIGQNKYLLFKPGDDAFDGHNMCELIGIEANQNPKRLAHLSLGGSTDKSILDNVVQTQNRYIVFENDNDTYPKWLVCEIPSDKRHATIEVYELEADFASYTI